jgi:dTDP-D-glucose 4,6-dehydratase
MHFAAQTSVDRSFETPIEFTRCNVLGTHSLLEAARNYGGIKLFLHISTDEVYGESINQSFYETDQLSPTNPYSASKAGGELLSLSYMKSFKVPVIITRSNNVYGRF